MSIAVGRLNISTRIFLGFGLILAILAGSIWFAIQASNHAMTAEDEYMRRAHQAEILLETKAEMIEVRRAVTLFLLKGGQITEIDTALTKLKEGITSSRETFKRAERKDRLTKALDALVEYRKGLDYLVRVREDKDEAAKALEILRAAGQSIQDQLIALTKDLNADLEKAAHDMDITSEENKNILMSVGIVGVLMGLLIAFVIGRGISVPVRNMTGVMGRLADGDLTVDVPNRKNTDEIGQMARAVEVFKENAIKVEAMRAEQAKAEERAAAERKKAMLDMADRFEASVMGVVKNVSAQATEMQATARSMAEIAQQTSRQATTVAAASNEATTNVETVASATEELSASTGEIGNRVTEAAQVSQRAADESARTNEMVQKLAVSAQKIGEVVSLINAIAAQTNLLALKQRLKLHAQAMRVRALPLLLVKLKILQARRLRQPKKSAARLMRFNPKPTVRWRRSRLFLK